MFFYLSRIFYFFFCSLKMVFRFLFYLFLPLCFLELHATTTMTNKKIRFTCKNHKNLIYTFVYLIRSINFIPFVLWIANCHWILKSLSSVINYGFSCSCSLSRWHKQKKKIPTEKKREENMFAFYAVRFEIVSMLFLF